MKRLMLAAMAAMLIAGCATKVRVSPGELDLFAPDVREHIKKREVSLGMSQIAVRYAWGAPKAVKSIPEENKEIWVYTNMRIHVTKLTFVNGKLKGSTSGVSFNNPIPAPDAQAQQDRIGTDADTPVEATTSGSEIKIEE